MGPPADKMITERDLLRGIALAALSMAAALLAWYLWG